MALVAGGKFLQKPLPLIPSTPKPFQPNNLIIRTGPRKPATLVLSVATRGEMKDGGHKNPQQSPPDTNTGHGPQTSSTPQGGNHSNGGSG
ncbi:hypothetical protein NMG60_11001335 [Bertholletia excelsa]